MRIKTIFFLNEIIAISMQLKNETWWLKLLNVHMEMSYSSYTKSCFAACSYYYSKNISSIKINTCYVFLMENVNTMCALHKNKFSLIKIKWILQWPSEAENCITLRREDLFRDCAFFSMLPNWRVWLPNCSIWLPNWRVWLLNFRVWLPNWRVWQPNWRVWQRVHIHGV